MSTVQHPDARANAPLQLVANALQACADALRALEQNGPIKTDGPTHYHAGSHGSKRRDGASKRRTEPTPPCLPPGVSPRAFLDACRTGELVASKVAGRWLARAEDVHAWIASRRAEKPIATTDAPASIAGWTRRGAR